ncbi:hypothetical protein [Pantoea sp. A4]|uniref:hypothetical protein n=1 Tax=Pantoea sp. A4 TaxID=1225184 RepID=UPI00036D70DA|nr:hypothetical protein [Pantoea sp. A4]
MSEHDVGKRIKGDISEENIKDNSLNEGHVNMSSSSSTPIINGPVDAVMGRHILAGIEGQMPEFYEFSLSGENKTYIRTEALKHLQGEI